MKASAHEIPVFMNENEEADWWASRAGRDYLKQKSAEARSKGVELN